MNKTPAYSLVPTRSCFRAREYAGIGARALALKHERVVRIKREITKTGFFGSYRLFWRGCKWEQFLLPNTLGFEFACKNIDIRALEYKPGVYEFAISKGSEKKYKVYVGQSGSIRIRHRKYAKTGDHLLKYFDAAIKDGCIIWRRCKYVKTKEKAIAWETKFLRKYDYAWNAQKNDRKRLISIVLQRFCLCMSSLQIVENK